MLMSIKEAVELAHQNYIQSNSIAGSFANMLKKTEKMARTMVTKCKKKRNSKK